MSMLHNWEQSCDRALHTCAHCTHLDVVFMRKFTSTDWRSAKRIKIVKTLSTRNTRLNVMLHTLELFIFFFLFLYKREVIRTSLVIFPLSQRVRIDPCEDASRNIKFNEIWMNQVRSSIEHNSHASARTGRTFAFHRGKNFAHVTSGSAARHLFFPPAYISIEKYTTVPKLLW